MLFYLNEARFSIFFLMLPSTTTSFALKPIVQENQINLNKTVCIKISNIIPCTLKFNINTSMTEYLISSTNVIIYTKKKSMKYYPLLPTTPKKMFHTKINSINRILNPTDMANVFIILLLHITI